MKKKCVCWLMAVLLVLSAGWGAAAKEPPPLKLDGAASVVLQYCGTFAEITDPAQVARLGEMFLAPAYEKGESNANYVGWEYMVRWYDAWGQEIEVVQVNTENLIAHGGYFYTLSGGQLDFQYFRRLLLPSYLTQDLQRVMEAVMGRPVIEKGFLAEAAPDAFMIEKDGKRAVFTDPETVKKSAALFEKVRVHRGWPDGTQEPAGFYVLTWGNKTAAPDMPVFARESFWYRPEDHLFRQNGYACILAHGQVDTDYLDALLA